MSTEPDKPARSTVQLVCTGKERSTKGDLYWLFRVVTPDGQKGDERLYSQKSLKSIRVGHVYQVDTDPTESTRIYVNTARWLRLWSDETEAAVWQTASAAFDTAELARKHEKQQTSRKLPVELLKPIRDEYRRTNSAGRLAIEVRVLAYLRLVSLDGEAR